MVLDMIATRCWARWGKINSGLAQQIAADMDRVAALIQGGGKVNRNRFHGANRIGSAALLLGEARMDKKYFYGFTTTSITTAIRISTGISLNHL